MAGTYTGKLTERSYNMHDVLATARTHDDMAREGGLEMSRFDQAMLGPALTMSIRGLRVDAAECLLVAKEIGRDAGQLKDRIHKLCRIAWPKGSRSYAPPATQLHRVLYDDMQAPKQRTRLGGYTTDREALVKVAEHPDTPPEAAEVAQIALDLRQLEEDRKVLAKSLGGDGRMHCQYKVARDVTARWATSKDIWGGGANLQGMSKRMRRIFIADDGHELVSIDLMQSESCCVAYLIGSQWYIDAHKSGNVHIMIGNYLFPKRAPGGKPWTKQNAKSIPLPWKPAWMWYDLFKREQHAINYMQSPDGLNRQTHMGIDLSRTQHAAYHAKMPELGAYQRWIGREIQDTHQLTTPMGRTRQFLGRVWERDEHKAAMAHMPQSTVSDINKVILYRIWKQLDCKLAHVLMENHDSVLFQVRKDDDSTIKRAYELAHVEVPVNGRTMVIGPEVERGRSWGRLSSWAV